MLFHRFRIGVSLTFVLKIIQDKETDLNWDSSGLQATKGSLGNNVSILVICGLTGFVFTLCLTNFVSRRLIGVFNVMIYLIALILNSLCEGGLIHPFGADHTYDKSV